MAKQIDMTVPVRPDPNSKDYQGQFGDIELLTDQAKYESTLEEQNAHFRTEVASILFNLETNNDVSLATYQLKKLLGKEG